MDGPKEQIPAMNRVKEILRNANFSSKAIKVLWLIMMMIIP